MKRLISFKLQVALAALVLIGLLAWESQVQLNRSYFQRAGRYYASQPQLAEAYYVRGLEYGEGDADVYFKLGFSSLRTQHYDRAIWALNLALAQGYPDRGIATVYLGAAQRYNGDPARARQTYDDALATLKDDLDSAMLAQLYSGRGWAIVSLEGCAAALPDFERALELNPDFVEAQKGREQCAPA